LTNDWSRTGNNVTKRAIEYIMAYPVATVWRPHATTAGGPMSMIRIFRDIERNQAMSIDLFQAVSGKGLSPRL